MTTTAVEATALVVTPESTNRGAATHSSENGETFKKVLHEQTEKSLEETNPDQRDATSKSTKRNRATSSSAPSVPAGSLETASLASIRSAADTRSQNVHVESKDTNEPTSALARSSDHSADSWRVLAATPDDTSVDGHSSVGTEVSSSTSADPSDTSFATTSATASEMSALTSLPEQAALVTSDGDATGVNPKTSAPSNDSGNSPRTINVTPSSTLADVVPSSLSADSSAIRTALRSVANLTSSRSGAARDGLNSTVSSAGATSDARHAPSVSVSTGRGFDGPIVAPQMATSARTMTSVAPNVSASSTAEASQLDVTDLASSISQATLGSDGSYTINVAMHPSDLGHVEAVVSLNGIDLHVAITPQTSSGHAALANAVETLKSELSRSGLNVNVSLRDPESRSGRGNEDPSRPSTVEADPPGAQIDSMPVSESLNVSQIHLIL
jgi:hypothetical protein